MTKNRIILLTASVLVLFVHFAVSQTTPVQVDASNATGTPPFGTFGGVNETINYETGNVSLRIPLLKLPGRNGHDLELAMNYNSKIYRLSYNYDEYFGFTYSWDIDDKSGWSVSVPQLDVTAQEIRWETNKIYSCNASFIFVDESGTKHAFEPVTTNNETNGGRTNCGYYNTQGSWVSYPSLNYLTPSTHSYMYADLSNASDVVVTDKHGTKYHFAFPTNGRPNWFSRRPFRIEDTNGNYISVTSDQSTATDTLGRSFTIPNLGASSNLNYYDSSGTQRTISWTVAPITITAQMNLPAREPNTWSFTRNVLTSITLATGRSYTFSYNSFGELNKITYPTGGYTKYDYDRYTALYPFYFRVRQSGRADTQADFREVIARRVCARADGNCSPSEEQVTTYTPTVNGNANNQYLDVRDPETNRTRYQFSTTGANQLYFSPRELGRWIYQGESTLERTTGTEYDSLNNGNTTQYSRPIHQTITLNDVLPNLVSRTEWDYDPLYTSADLPTTKREYDFGVSTPGLLRRTDTRWLKTNSVNGQDYSSTSIHMYDRKASESVYDGSSNLVAQTTYEYDSYTEGIAASNSVQRVARTLPRGNDLLP